MQSYSTLYWHYSGRPKLAPTKLYNPLLESSFIYKSITGFTVAYTIPT